MLVADKQPLSRQDTRCDPTREAHLLSCQELQHLSPYTLTISTELLEAGATKPSLARPSR